MQLLNQSESVTMDRFLLAVCLLYLCMDNCSSAIVTAKKDTSPQPGLPFSSPIPAAAALNSVPNKHILKPYFEDVGSRNITAVVGQVTVLKCRVKQLGERTVSWMRKRDLHILTTNVYTYTGDGRFSVIHPQSSDEWNLKIDYAQRRDAGIYECQVNTEPKMNMAVMLHVEDQNGPRRSGEFRNVTQKDAQATIQGQTEQHVKTGSTISLVCLVNVHSNPPGSVLWFQDTNKIDFDSPRGGISLETEKTEKGTTSKLLVTKATLADSGNYTCVPSNASPASVYIHVLNGEHPAAMQHGGASNVVAWSFTLIMAAGVTSLT